MNKTDVIDFFDRLAPTWDSDMIRKESVIQKILDYGGVAGGKNVLDVACGTGVLFRDYLERGVRSVVGVDISSEMAKIAAGKCQDSRVKVICADIEQVELEGKFDCIMIYNAFPHFPNPEAVLAHLSGCLAEGGRITVAHGMSREKIDAHHRGSASKVSLGLMHERTLADLMEKWFAVDVILSDQEKYVVSGTAGKGTV